MGRRTASEPDRGGPHAPRHGTPSRPALRGSQDHPGIQAPVVLTTLGVGAANSPRFAPAGLLVEAEGRRVMFDGGPGGSPGPPLDAWLVTDEQAELIARIRPLARALGVDPRMGDLTLGRLIVECHPVVHTNHPAAGYLIRTGAGVVVWAPEFFEFPGWARGADIMFAEAAGWARPIRFARGAGGHLDALAVSRAAQVQAIRRLVFAHIGRPTIKATERGERPPFGELGRDGQIYTLPAKSGGEAP